MEKQTALLQNRKTARLLYWLCFVCLMLAAGVLLFGRLSAARLEDYDELRHGQNAYEMLQSGDYIVHTYHGEADYYNCKPPLGCGSSRWATVCSAIICWGCAFSAP